MKPTTWQNWLCRAGCGTAIIGLFFALMASAGAQAAGGRGGGIGIRGPDPNKAVPIDNPFIGVVVSASSSSITVEGKRGRDKRGQRDQNADAESKVRTHFLISGDTKITRDGKTITAADIKKDEQVRVMFTAKEGSILRRATEVQIGQAAAEAGKDQQEKGKGGKKAKK